MTTQKLFSQLENVREKIKIPLVIMGYLNPMMQYGIEKFCKYCQKIGIDGLIIPDLPLEEASKFSKIISSYFIDLILLVAPTTPFERMKMISNKTKGFTYLVSVTGVTGERNKMENRVENLITKLKDISTKPVAVGFGISTPEHVKKVRAWGADGVIVGSAFVKRISNCNKKEVVDMIGNYCEEMREAADKEI